MAPVCTTTPALSSAAPGRTDRPRTSVGSNGGVFQSDSSPAGWNVVMCVQQNRRLSRSMEPVGVDVRMGVGQGQDLHILEAAFPAQVGNRLCAVVELAEVGSVEADRKESGTGPSNLPDIPAVRSSSLFNAAWVDMQTPRPPAFGVGADCDHCDRNGNVRQSRIAWRGGCARSRASVSSLSGADFARPALGHREPSGPAIHHRQGSEGRQPPKILATRATFRA